MQKVVQGLLINYEITGNGRKNLIILHGWGGSLEEWKSTANYLSNKYKVIVLDFPGFGGSNKPRDNWGTFEYANFTKDFLKSLGVKKVIIVGHSFGGRVGILLASRTDLVEKLILVDAAGMELKNLKVKILNFFSPIFRLVPQRFKNKDPMRKTFIKVINQSLRGELVKIKIPTVIIWGERDKVLPFREAQFLHKGIKGSILRIVWGTSHWPHLEKFTDFVKILEEEEI